MNLTKFCQISVMVMLVSQTMAVSLNVCKPHHGVTIYHEAIVSDGLIKKQTTIFREKILYVSVEFIKVLVAQPIASMVCTPITTLAMATGPITGGVVGTSCYIGTVTGVNNIIPSTEVTNLEDN